ncbi:hypothetical protein ACFE04_020227 [Oxalis oulophora]
MVLLSKIWDDVAGGPQPEHGLDRLRNKTTPIDIKEGSSGKWYQRSMSMPVAVSPPETPSPPSSARNNNVWRSVFHPGSNLATKGIGNQKFDNPLPNSPTVYDWLYSGETRSKHHR